MKNTSFSAYRLEDSISVASYWSEMLTTKRDQKNSGEFVVLDLSLMQEDEE